MENERRLIDANAFKSLLCKCCNILHSEEPCEPSECNVMAVIDEQPTVDAVEVIRCRDCKHWHEETGWCTKHSHFIGCDGMACHPSQSSEWKMLNADDFCSYGERKDNEKG